MKRRALLAALAFAPVAARAQLFNPGAPTLAARDGLIAPGAAAVDTDAQSWADAVVANSGLVSAGRLALVSDLISAWKAAGVWPLIDDAWLLVAENVPQALTSLKQRRLAVSVSAPSFSADQGYAFNGTSSYLDTGFLPGTHATAMTGTNMRLAVYERTNAAVTGIAAGTADSATKNLLIFPRSAGNNLAVGLNCAQSTFLSGVLDSRGLWAASRTAAGVFESFRNGVSNGTATGATPTTVIPTRSLYIGAHDSVGTVNSYRAATEGFVSVGASMSAAQELAFYSPLQSFMTSVGANV